MDSTHVETRFEKIDPPLPPLAPTRTQEQGVGTYLSLFLLSLALGLGAKYALPLQFHLVLRGPDITHMKGVSILLAAAATSIVLHEGGHLLAALLMDFEIMALAVGPFRFVRLNESWEFRFTPRSFFSGSVSAVPRKFAGWRARMLAVVVAGPIATLLTGLTAAGLLLSHLSVTLPNTFLSAVAQLSVFIFVLGLLPNSGRAKVRNDARLLLVLTSDSKEALEILLYHQLTRLELAGTRPKDYPESLMRELSQQQGRPDLMLFSAHKIVLWALDRGQTATADLWDRRCLELSESCQPASRNLALAHSACLDMLVRRCPHDARAKFADVDWQTLSPAWLMHRARAAYYLAMSAVPECLAEIASAQHSSPNQSSFTLFERNLLTQLHRQALNTRPPELGQGCAA